MSGCWVNIFARGQGLPLNSSHQHPTQIEAEYWSAVVRQSSGPKARTFYRIHIIPKR